MGGSTTLTSVAVDDGGTFEDMEMADETESDGDGDRDEN